ncbi:hypothetical protein [Enterococcus viikkiensis]|uniref:hypothetical protein n=1 Tax=Enterococcus viikkiensis TaxID=930854 RepID=UPI0010F9FB70|nr:hypothetical protein [Enterococcus viikkiensis]
MRLDLKRDPLIVVRNPNQYKDIKQLVSNQKKSLLNEDDYKKSVEKAAARFEKVAFDFDR